MAKANPAQQVVPIKEIKNGVIILKDGTMRGVLLGSSLNFALKSEEEQSAIILQFQNMLNSIEFPIQFFVQSRDLDIRPYLALLEERHAVQTNDLLKIQTREYIEFVKGFVESVNIMSKGFFIVVPYTPSLGGGSVASKKGPFGFLKKDGAPQTAAQNKIEQFEENRSQLEQRLAVVTQGLSRAGIRVEQLGTEELVELFYKLFNPGELGKPMTPQT